ncbi:tRNA (guanosine(37)-N1)-methyltransferase TrmD [Mycoplasmoides gallisepticum]|uniref:tRNA (guanosine(37)-N1)-methyltransferase TrmD n=1 Tax=Mycoplasmoides gallisepticum TaxID=2096 RepID=UPI002184B585|nr:tRNA (guanosine(37)-N1)-methyltransferase TrmD [Mycoplasmoides gallisepticum]UQZ95789.1 tRNA (guanosine(37)-N1)-methyltransferase TrmD [Mycoplasmoides gallisepticum]
MKIVVLTLFDDFVRSYYDFSIIRNALDKKAVELEVINFRQYANDKHKTVDDTIYGGSAGMLLKLEPLVNCLRDIKQNQFKDPNKIRTYLLSPQGEVYDQNKAVALSQSDHDLILIAGRYEGFDERIYHYVDGALSVGDFVITGGELAALIVVDSIVRLLPNVINKYSLSSESFNNYLLDYPMYTKPYDFEGYKVPDVLLSGNHQAIAAFNQQEAINNTKMKRPDLYLKYKSNLK